ncbi:MAG: hypothetical protein HY684_07730 [Chloroflexi bacterium]|nr:hypothetical protein [Chloroflexota bacterium]
MQLPDEWREKLVGELRNAARMMRAARDPADKLFFFSASFGETGRILNYHWDCDVVLMHVVLQTAYNTINQRIQLTASGSDRAVKLPAEFYDALTKTVEDLAEVVATMQASARRKDVSSIPDVLARMAELSYMSTGNGYYLYTKGALTPGGLSGP